MKINLNAAAQMALEGEFHILHDYLLDGGFDEESILQIEEEIKDYMSQQDAEFIDLPVENVSAHLQDAYARGWDDGYEVVRDNESDVEYPSCEAPDGGWDSWLINGVGIDKTCKLLGEDPEESEDGWSDSMKEKLIAYHQGACTGAQEGVNDYLVAGVGEIIGAFLP